MSSTSTFTQKVLIASVVFLLVAAAIYLLATFFKFFLLVFAGLLLAVLLSAIANFLVRKLKLPRGIGLAIAVVLFLSFTIGSWWVMAPTITEQVSDLREALPKAMQKVKESALKRKVGREVVAQLELNGSSRQPAASAKSVFSRATKLFASTLDVIADCMIILITGIFFAANPMIYLLNVVNLFPPKFRTRFMEVLGLCYETLKRWLLAKFFSMLIIGVFTWLGLVLLDVPMALVLALIAFFITFIPTIGPYLSAVPAVMVAFMEGTDMAFYVILLYFGIQMIETYLITPIIYQKTVSIPPAITLFSLVFLGIFSGVLGVLMSGPLVAAVRVFIRELYIKDFLERKPEPATSKPNSKNDRPLFD